MALAEFMDAVASNTARLRDREMARTKQHTATLQEAWRLAGEVYVESVGAVVDVFNNETEFFYIPEILPTRDNLLSTQRDFRRAFYVRVAAQLPSRSRVLVIGCGGDTAPIEAFQLAGHEVIATDFNQEIVDAMQRRVDTPTFACDLVHLDEVLPEPVDVVFGNSTLGYVAPSKLRKVVSNVSGGSRLGGVFTFDLTPHPHYFYMATDKRAQTVANESSPDPADLLAFVERLGVAKGIAAMAAYHAARTLAVGGALLAILRREFEASGARCATFAYDIVNGRGGKHPSLSLRVSRGFETLLQPVVPERAYGEPRDLIREDREGGSMLVLPYIDRGMGEALARRLGVHRSWRDDAWLVGDYLRKHQPGREAVREARAAVQADIDPELYATRISRFVDGQDYTPPPRPRFAVLRDQYLRKMYLAGDANVDQETVDRAIDAAYAGHDGPVEPVSKRPAPAKAIAVPGRNDQCPCGSGKKYKKCHGA